MRTPPGGTHQGEAWEAAGGWGGGGRKREGRREEEGGREARREAEGKTAPHGDGKMTAK